MSSLSEEQIRLLLEGEANRSRRGPKVDITLERTIPVWYRLQHHICTADCSHRESSPSNRACWNPECKDPRPLEDKGANCVSEVSGKFMCRYCFLDGWLLPF